MLDFKAARHFVDVELDRLLAKSITRLEAAVESATPETTLGEVVDGLARELRLTCDVLEMSIVDFRHIKMKDLD